MRTRIFRKSSGFTLVEIMFVIAIIALLVLLALPNMIRARHVSQKNACIKNLSTMDGLKHMWGLDNKKTTGDTPDFTDLVGPDLYIKRMPECPANGAYSLNPIGTAPTCTVSGHTL